MYLYLTSNINNYARKKNKEAVYDVCKTEHFFQ